MSKFKPRYLVYPLALSALTWWASYTWLRRMPDGGSFAFLVVFPAAVLLGLGCGFAVAWIQKRSLSIAMLLLVIYIGFFGGYIAYYGPIQYIISKCAGRVLSEFRKSRDVALMNSWCIKESDNGKFLAIAETLHDAKTLTAVAEKSGRSYRNLECAYLKIAVATADLKSIQRLLDQGLSPLCEFNHVSPYSYLRMETGRLKGNLELQQKVLNQLSRNLDDRVFITGYEKPFILETLIKKGSPVTVNAVSAVIRSENHQGFKALLGYFNISKNTTPAIYNDRLALAMKWKCNFQLDLKRFIERGATDVSSLSRKWRNLKKSKGPRGKSTRSLAKEWHAYIEILRMLGRAPKMSDCSVRYDSDYDRYWRKFFFKEATNIRMLCHTPKEDLHRRETPTPPPANKLLKAKRFLFPKLTDKETQVALNKQPRSRYVIRVLRGRISGFENPGISFKLYSQPDPHSKLLLEKTRASKRVTRSDGGLHCTYKRTRGETRCLKLMKKGISDDNYRIYSLDYSDVIAGKEDPGRERWYKVRFGKIDGWVMIPAYSRGGYNYPVKLKVSHIQLFPGEILTLKPGAVIYSGPGGTEEIQTRFDPAAMQLIAPRQEEIQWVNGRPYIKVKLEHLRISDAYCMGRAKPGIINEGYIQLFDERGNFNIGSFDLLD